MASTRVRASIGRRVEKYGRKCLCVACGLRQQRHLKGTRLRHLRCWHCGEKGCVRTVWWIVAFPDQARALAAEYRQLDEILAVGRRGKAEFERIDSTLAELIR